MAHILSIKSKGKIERYVESVIVALNKAAENGESMDVVIEGKGKTIGKAITVAEIIKRKFGEGNFDQTNKIHEIEIKPGTSQDRQKFVSCITIKLTPIGKLPKVEERTDTKQETKEKIPKIRLKPTNNIGEINFGAHE